MSDEKTTTTAAPIPPEGHELPEVNARPISRRLLQFTAQAFNNARRNTGTLPPANESAPARGSRTTAPRSPQKAGGPIRTTLSGAAAVLRAARPAPRTLPDAMREEDATDAALESLEDMPVIITGYAPSAPVRESRPAPARRPASSSGGGIVSPAIAAFRRLVQG